jgi:hypothetical protein
MRAIIFKEPLDVTIAQAIASPKPIDDAGK